MYKCEFCKKSTPSSTPCQKLVTQVRMFQHPFRARIHKRWVVDKMGKNKVEWRDDPGGTGLQIVAEAEACPECAAKVRDRFPILVKEYGY